MVAGGEVGNVARSRDHSVNNPAVTLRSDVRFHPEIPWVALLGLRPLWVTGPVSSPRSIPNRNALFQATEGFLNRALKSFEQSPIAVKRAGNVFILFSYSNQGWPTPPRAKPQGSKRSLFKDLRHAVLRTMVNLQIWCSQVGPLA